jgi:hypothetical protein
VAQIEEASDRRGPGPNVAYGYVPISGPFEARKSAAGSVALFCVAGVPAAIDESRFKALLGIMRPEPA